MSICCLLFNCYYLCLVMILRLFVLFVFSVVCFCMCLFNVWLFTLIFLWFVVVDLVLVVCFPVWLCF